MVGHRLVILRLYDQVLGGVGVRQFDGFLFVAHQNDEAVLQRTLGYLLAGQAVELAVHFLLHIVDDLVRGGNQYHL